MIDKVKFCFDYETNKISTKNSVLIFGSLISTQLESFESNMYHLNSIHNTLDVYMIIFNILRLNLSFL